MQICGCAELMVGGSLSDAMRMSRHFTLRRAMEIAVDPARGLAYLHAKKNGAIIHRSAITLGPVGSNPNNKMPFSEEASCTCAGT